MKLQFFAALIILPAALNATYLTYATSSGLIVSQSSGNIEVTNGLIQPGSLATGSAVISGSGNLFASATSVAIAPFGTLASANLATGALKANAINESGAIISGGSISRARLIDDLTFTNATGSTQYLTITQTITGSIGSTDNFWRGSTVFAQLSFSVLSPSGSITFRSAGAANNTDMIYNISNESDPFFTSTAGNQQSGFTGPNSGLIWDTISDGGYNARMSTVLAFAPGQSTLRLLSELMVDCRYTTSCEFGNSSITTFAPLPTGLTFTSDSGVFLSAQSAAVPEPTTTLAALTGLACLTLIRRRL